MQPPPLILTREQVRRVDQIAIHDFCVPGIVLMENAARGAVQAIQNAKLPLGNVLILCGGGNNGGDGLAIARHLHNTGSQVTIGLCVDPAKYQGDARINWQIVQAMKLQSFSADPGELRTRLPRHESDTKFDLIVDAIFGTGLSTPPRPPFGQIVEHIERSNLPVVAIDLPSGLDCDTGKPLGAQAVRAVTTVTFVGLKQGFTNPSSTAFTGQVQVVDIGCPAEAIRRAMS